MPITNVTSGIQVNVASGSNNISITVGRGVYSPFTSDIVVNTATNAINVLGASQPNITSLGTLSNLAIAGDLTTVDSITFDTAAAETYAQAKLYWDTVEGTLNLGLQNNVVHHIGQQVLIYAKAASAITKGQSVMFAGVQGDHVLVAPANSAAPGFIKEWILGVAGDNISSGSFGYVTVFGKIDNVDTNGFAAGALLWFDPTVTGGMIDSQPTGNNPQVLMCAVIKAETAPSANNGTLLVRVTFDPAITDIQGIAISNPQNGEVLTYNSASGLWVNGTVVAPPSSTATNLAGGATGSIPYQSAPGITAFINIGANGTVLTSNGTTATWVTPSGGASTTATNIAGGTAGQIVIQSAPGVTAFAGPGTSGQILRSNGTSAPTYVNQSTLSVGTATNIAAGTAGQLHIQTAPGVTGFAGPGTAGQLLQSNGTSAPTYVNTATLIVGNATNAVNASNASNIAGGTAGQLVVQSGSGATTFAGPGTAGQLLQSNGTSTPTYVNTASLVVGFASQASTVTGAAQTAITSVGTLTSLAVSGTTNLGTITNVTILGGTNGQVMTTNGSGGLSWTTVSGGSGSPGGTDRQVQFNNAGAFGGASRLNIDTNGLPSLVNYASTATLPAATTGSIALASKAVDGYALLNVINANGFNSPVANHTGFRFPRSLKGTYALAAPINSGFPAPTAGGTATAETYASTNAWTRSPRTKAVSATSAGSVAGWRTTNSSAHHIARIGEDGFFFLAKWAVVVTVATRQIAVGLFPALNAFPAATFDTQVNSIFMGMTENDTNLQIFHNDAAGNCTKIDLGANFPAPTANQDFYEFILTSDPGGSTVNYQVTNVHNGNFASGSLTTNLPATSIGLAPMAFMYNGTTASAVEFGLNTLYIEGNW